MIHATTVQIRWLLMSLTWSFLINVKQVYILKCLMQEWGTSSRLAVCTRPMKSFGLALPRQSQLKLEILINLAFLVATWIYIKWIIIIKLILRASKEHALWDRQDTYKYMTSQTFMLLLWCNGSSTCIVVTSRKISARHPESVQVAIVLTLCGKTMSSPMRSLIFKLIMWAM